MSKTTDEALARLEHKLDVVLDFLVVLMKKTITPNISIPKMGDSTHSCPVCKQGVKYVIDVQERSVSAQCGCKTGKFAPLDLEQFAPPSAAGGKNDGREGDGDSASEGHDRGRERQQRPRSR